MAAPSMRTVTVRIEPLYREHVDAMCPVCATWAVEVFTYVVRVAATLKLATFTRCGGCAGRGR